jgi:copper(I)-binding protein
MIRSNTLKKAGFALVAATCSIALVACSSSTDESTPEVTVPAETTEQPATSAPQDTTPMVETVTVADAWARSVPGGMGAIYATFTSPTDDAILSASIEPAAAAGKVEVHEVVADASGKMAMQMIERVELAAGQPVQFKPGSYHIMLMEMPEVLPVGTEITVTVVLEKAGPVMFTAVVRENTMPDMGSGSMDMDSGSMDMGSGSMDSGSMDMGSGSMDSGSMDMGSGSMDSGSMGSGSMGSESEEMSNGGMNG